MKVTKATGRYNNWDFIIRFEIPDDIREEEVANWICKFFSNHFVLTKHGWNIIAGGCTENTNSYKKFNTINHDDICTDYYKLNCYEKDLTLFTLKWGDVL